MRDALVTGKGTPRLWALSLIVGCGIAPAPDDIRKVVMLRQLEEKSVTFISQAKFDAASQDVRRMGARIAQGHEQRAKDMRAYLTAYGPNMRDEEHTDAPCFPPEKSARVIVPGGSIDALVVERLAEHHQCALRLTKELERSANETTRALGRHLSEDYAAELASLKVLRP